MTETNQKPKRTLLPDKESPKTKPSLLPPRPPKPPKKTGVSAPEPGKEKRRETEWWQV